MAALFRAQPGFQQAGIHVSRIRYLYHKRNLTVMESPMPFHSFLQQISETVWEIPPSYKQGMRVPARILRNPKD